MRGVWVFLSAILLCGASAFADEQVTKVTFYVNEIQ